MKLSQPMERQSSETYIFFVTKLNTERPLQKWGDPSSYSPDGEDRPAQAKDCCVPESGSLLWVPASCGPIVSLAHVNPFTFVAQCLLLMGSCGWALRNWELPGGACLCLLVIFRRRNMIFSKVGLTMKELQIQSSEHHPKHPIDWETEGFLWQVRTCGVDRDASNLASTEHSQVGSLQGWVACFSARQQPHQLSCNDSLCSLSLSLFSLCYLDLPFCIYNSRVDGKRASEVFESTLPCQKLL